MNHKFTRKYSILTKDGFQKFDGVKKTQHYFSYTFKFENGSEITCSGSHLFNTVDDIFIEANKFKIGEKIGDNIIIDIKENQKKQELYDLLNVENGNHYITSGVTSHNCAFIRPSIWQEFEDSIFPSQSGLAWKKNIILSTANGMNHFYTLVKGARNGTNGMNIFEVNWRDVPRFKPNGEQMATEEFQKKIIDKHGIVYFNQNYANEFLGSSYTLISANKLQEMLSAEIEEIRDGKLKIYHYPEKGHKYIMTVDAAKDGNDAFALHIIDITNFHFKQVASAQLQIDYLLMPEFINEWCDFYNKPYLVIENNEGAGQSIADQMKNDYEYENLHYDKDVGNNKKKKYPGFRTTSRSRKQILQTLKLFIENGSLEINDKNTIDEFYTFILINNKYQADDGAHDDLIMSLALAFVPFVNSKNFEDMKLLIKNLYSEDDLEDSEKIGFSDALVIGSFDDFSDEEYKQPNTEYISFENGGLFSV